MESSVSLLINFRINFLVNAICGMGFFHRFPPVTTRVPGNSTPPHPLPRLSPLSIIHCGAFFMSYVCPFNCWERERAGNDGNFTRNSCKRFCDLFFNEAKTAIITIQRYTKLTHDCTQVGLGFSEWNVGDGQVGEAIFYVFPLLASPFDEGFCGLRQPNCLCSVFLSLFSLFFAFFSAFQVTSCLSPGCCLVARQSCHAGSISSPVCVIYIAEIKF